ncbi:MAG: DUF362 domain-containing protein [Planctomycetes bacterium]|nr:DUF362 domain-containing protein [Planctomycetota bacterium]
MATRKKASSSSSRSAASSKSPKRTPAARAPKRKARASNSDDESRDDDDEPRDDEARDDADEATASDDDGDGDEGAGTRDDHRGDHRGDDEDAADDDEEADDRPAPRTRAVQRAAPGAASPPAPLTAPSSGARPPQSAPSAPPRAPAAAPPPAFAPLPPAPIVRGAARPFVVARGEDAAKVFGETLKHSGFYEAVENAQIKSGKRRELFEVACKVDFMRGVRKEAEPLSYVDPKLVAQLFNGLLDRGFRILRVVETRGELSRYLSRRSVKQVGAALGYDESCYELRDLADELVPVELGTLGKKPTGRIWKQADFRIVFAKNRTDEQWGPALALWNVWHTLATPTDLVSLEYGTDPGDLTLALLEKLPVHFALIDAVHSRDGALPGVFPYEVLRALDPQAPDGPSQLRLGTLVAGSDVLAVEAAGQKLQGLDPLLDPLCLRRLRKATGWKAPAEVDGLPTYPGWRGVGNKIREAIGVEKPAEALRLALCAALLQADLRLFPPHASAYQSLRLRQKAEQFAEELRRRHGVRATVAAGGAPPPGPARNEPVDDLADGDDDDEGDDPPRFV